MTAFDQIQELLTSMPTWGLLLFFLGSAMLEYVIPPYWGDLVVLLAFSWALQGAVAPAVVFVTCVAGSSIGAAVAYAIGHRYGLGVARRVIRLGLRASPDRGRVDALPSRFGAPFLVANRFLPVLRGLLLYGAGAVRLPFGRSMAYTLCSNVAWTGLLWLVAHLSRDLGWSELLLAFEETSRAAAAAAVALLLSILALVLWRDRRVRDRA